MIRHKGRFWSGIFEKHTSSWVISSWKTWNGSRLLVMRVSCYCSCLMAFPIPWEKLCLMKQRGNSVWMWTAVQEVHTQHITIPNDITIEAAGRWNSADSIWLVPRSEVVSLSLPLWCAQNHCAHHLYLDSEIICCTRRLVHPSIRRVIMKFRVGAMGINSGSRGKQYGNHTNL